MLGRVNQFTAKVKSRAEVEIFPADTRYGMFIARVDSIYFDMIKYNLKPIQ
jgi:hypothetical protein